MSKKLNIDDVTRGAMAVIIAQVLPKEEEGLTVAQAAQMLGISVAKLSQMRYTKKGPGFYRDGDSVFYKPSSLMAYISQTNHQPKKNRRVA